MEIIKHHIKKHVGVHHINTLEKFLIFLAIIAAGIFGTIYGVRAYPEVFGTDVAKSNLNEISLQEPIALEFSTPVFRKYYDSKITISPSEKIKLRWENSNKRLLIVPEDFWRPDSQYEISFPEGKNIMFSTVPGETISFSTEKYPAVSSVSPKDGAENVTVDMEEPILVKFKKPVFDYSFKFALNSDEEFSVQSNVNNDEFKLLPKNGTDYATQYDFKIFAKYKKESDGNYEQIFESSFSTTAPPQIIWDKDHKVRLEQAKKYTQAKIKTGKYIDVNLSAQVMSIFENGKILDDFMISSGKRGMDTPKGETKIYNKFPRAYSSAYGLYMPYWMALTAGGKFGIHELPEWPNGYKEGQAHLGTPVSHGCVRLGVGSAQKVYEWAEIGTPVVIY